MRPAPLYKCPGVKEIIVVGSSLIADNGREFSILSIRASKVVNSSKVNLTFEATFRR